MHLLYVNIRLWEWGQIHKRKIVQRKNKRKKQVTQMKTRKAKIFYTDTQHTLSL